MNSLFGFVLMGLILSGLYYFWLKARIHGLSISIIVLAFIFWPVAVLTGLYWGGKDFYYYQKSK